MSRISVIHLHPRFFEDISTEWADNDIFLLEGHEGNVDGVDVCVYVAVGALQRAARIQMHRAD